MSKKGAGMIVVRYPRHLVALTEDELQELLKAQPDIWAAAIRRGKGYARAEKAMERRPK